MYQKKIVVALSGGVDSSTTLLMLKKQNYNIKCAVFMKNWEEDDNSHYCADEQDIEDAKKYAIISKSHLKKLTFLMNIGIKYSKIT